MPTSHQWHGDAIAAEIARATLRAWRQSRLTSFVWRIP